MLLLLLLLLLRLPLLLLHKSFINSKLAFSKYEQETVQNEALQLFSFFKETRRLTYNIKVDLKKKILQQQQRKKYIKGKEKERREREAPTDT